MHCKPILLQNGAIPDADEPFVYSWGVWGNEKGLEICTSWAGLVKDESIITPLPPPPEDIFNVGRALYDARTVMKLMLG